MGRGVPGFVKGVGKVVRISRRITAEDRAKLRAMEPCLDKAPTAPVFATTNSQKIYAASMMADQGGACRLGSIRGRGLP